MLSTVQSLSMCSCPFDCKYFEIRSAGAPRVIELEILVPNVCVCVCVCVCVTKMEAWRSQGHWMTAISGQFCAEVAHLQLKRLSFTHTGHTCSKRRFCHGFVPVSIKA